MRSPACGLISPESARKCDCGYNFQTRGSQGLGPRGDNRAPASSHPIHHNLSEMLQCVRTLQTLAAPIIVVQTVLGLLTGSVILRGLLHPMLKTAGLVLGALIGAALRGLIGYVVGLILSVGLRLWAQIALCLMDIEGNTRHEEP